MVGHHTVCEKVVIASVVIIQITPNQCCHSRPGKPIDLARLIKILIVGCKEPFVSSFSLLHNSKSSRDPLLETSLPHFSQAFQDVLRNRAMEAISDKVHGTRNVPVR